MVDRIVVIDGVSKQYAMTGWRIGWSISPPNLARALEIVQGQTTTNATAVAQHAAVAALEAKAPDDLPAYRKLVLDVAQSVAEAAKGVAPTETTALETVKAAVGG